MWHAHPLRTSAYEKCSLWLDTLYLYTLLFKGLTEIEEPAIHFPHDFVSNATYFPNNDTYDMTNIVDGIYIDMLNSMEKVLNFSTKLYKRKDGQWTPPKTLPNGTIILG